MLARGGEQADVGGILAGYMAGATWSMPMADMLPDPPEPATRPDGGVGGVARALPTAAIAAVSQGGGFGRRTVGHGGHPTSIGQACSGLPTSQDSGVGGRVEVLAPPVRIARTVRIDSAVCTDHAVPPAGQRAVSASCQMRPGRAPGDRTMGGQEQDGEDWTEWCCARSRSNAHEARRPGCGGRRDQRRDGSGEGAADRQPRQTARHAGEVGGASRSGDPQGGGAHQRRGSPRRPGRWLCRHHPPRRW